MSGRTEVAARSGPGGMGEVYRARDRKLGRDVAIKALPSALASDPDRLTRLEQEARILARLNHPHIGTIYGLEESGDASYLVLELIDGETLDERLSRTGPIALEEALRIASQIADALEAASAKGITHRDIKPSNIKVTSESRVKVLDFGIARSVAPSEIQDDVSTRSAVTPSLPASGGVAGTPPYMSPEQIRGQVTDQRTDVWAFGCVVFELLCGRRPFRGSTVPDVLAAILQSEPDWSALPASVPADVRRLLRKCLEKDVSRRWQTFGDLRAELARAISAQAGHGYARPLTVLLLGSLPVVLTAVLASGRPAFLNGLERPVYDTILRRSTSPPPDSRVVIVDVDEPSLAKIGQWPWRRDVIGRLIDRLRELGASAIALDMFFPEPDRSGGFASADDGTLRQRTPDDVLAESLRAGKVVLGYGLMFNWGARTLDHCQLQPFNLAIPSSPGTTGSVEAPFFKATGAVCSLAPLAAAAAQAGFLNALPDSDGVFVAHRSSSNSTVACIPASLLRPWQWGHPVGMRLCVSRLRITCRWCSASGSCRSMAGAICCSATADHDGHFATYRLLTSWQGRRLLRRSGTGSSSWVRQRSAIARPWPRPSTPRS